MDRDFNEGIEKILLAWRGVNALVGRYYGWIFLLSVLVGGIIGGIAGAFAGGVGAAPGAVGGIKIGAVVAEKIGFAILISAIAAEGALIGKSMSDIAAAHTEEELEHEYEQIADSALALGIMGALVALGALAVRFARAVVSRATTFLRRLVTKETGTIWDWIKPTQDVWPGTPIPRSFEMTAGNIRVWVHGNATEHLAEYAQSMLNRGINPKLVNVGIQAQLRSLQAAVQSATANGVKYNKFMNVGGWELKFAPPRAEGQLPALIHALPIR